MNQYTSNDMWSSLLEKIEFFLRKQPDGCWLWTRGTLNGYGSVSWGRKMHYVHRAYLEELGHDLPDGMDVDHLCMVKLCANPAHLEVVTHAENVRRYTATITHCAHGHEFTSETTVVKERRPGYFKRECRICINANARRRWAERQAQ